MEKTIIKMISELSDINISEINLTSTFTELHFDNLDVAELIMAIEDKLEISAPRNIHFSETVGELINQIKKLN